MVLVVEVGAFYKRHFKLRNCEKTKNILEPFAYGKKPSANFRHLALEVLVTKNTFEKFFVFSQIRNLKLEYKVVLKKKNINILYCHFIWTNILRIF